MYSHFLKELGSTNILNNKNHCVNFLKNTGKKIAEKNIENTFVTQ
jgi:hypothetical protein